MAKSMAPLPEFSRPIAADRIGPQETTWEIAADEPERARMAARFGLLALDRLAARLELKRGPAGVIQLRGRFEAEVVQACVVTLEPVRSRVSESFAVAFGAAPVAPGGDVVIGVDEVDPPEELSDGRIDLGEVVAQQLAVALDPYPRAPGVDDRFEMTDRVGSPAESGTRPFAALERLRPRRT